MLVCGWALTSHQFPGPKSGEQESSYGVLERMGATNSGFKGTAGCLPDDRFESLGADIPRGQFRAS